jgi:hypothetical protein
VGTQFRILLRYQPPSIGGILGSVKHRLIRIVLQPARKPPAALECERQIGPVRQARIKMFSKTYRLVIKQLLWHANYMMHRSKKRPGRSMRVAGIQNYELAPGCQSEYGRKSFRGKWPVFEHRRTVGIPMAREVENIWGFVLYHPGKIFRCDVGFNRPLNLSATVGSTPPTYLPCLPRSVDPFFRGISESQEEHLGHLIFPSGLSRQEVIFRNTKNSYSG